MLIQSAVKAEKGEGEPVFIEFQAPVDEENPTSEIDYGYDYQTGPLEDIELLKQGQYQAFCHRQCLKMAYYIQKVYGYELLYMKAEFFKDQNGTIWLFYSKDIKWRETLRKDITSTHEAKKQAKKMAANKEALRKQMVNEL